MIKFEWTQDFNVICGTPCLGKSTMAKKYSNVIDLASSPYKYLDYNPTLAEIKKGCWEKRNPNFLKDYVDAIEEYSKTNIILLPMFDYVRNEMDIRGIKFAIAYSPSEDKDIIKERFKLRGNNTDFIKKIMDEYDSWLESFKKDNHIKILVKKMFLENALIEYQRKNK